MKKKSEALGVLYPRAKKLLLIMRLSIFLVLISVLASSASVYSQATKLTVKMKNCKIADVFDAIEQQSDFYFFYSRDNFDDNRLVSVDIEGKTVEKILDEIFEDQAISYEIVNKNILIKTMNRLTATSDLQQKTVSGTVTDKSGQPLPGVTVIIKGTSQGTVTDADGKYSLSNIPGDATLVFSFVGMRPQEAIVASKTSIDITMEVDAIGLDEVVAVGYGTVKKSDITGSISSVSSEKVVQVKAISNIAQALQGQTAGVQVNQRSGQPGESMSIKIRGTNSISAGNDPLYVVDGMPLNSLSAQLNPNDIESIEILKDASSTAIYGSRGANGVIMITTKSGNEGKTKIVYDAYVGVQSLRKKMDLVNAKEFAQLQNEVATNDGTNLPWTQTQIEALGEGTDWQDLVYRNALVQNHNLSFSGGAKNTKFYTSFGYFDQNGIILNSGVKRLSFIGKIDQKLNEKLNLTTNVTFSNTNYRQAVYTSADGGGGIPFTTMVMPPTQNVKDENGNYTVFTGVSWGATNPVGISTELYNPSVNSRLIGNVALNYKILKELTLKVSAGVDGSYNKTDYYAPSSLSIGQPGGRAYKNYSNELSIINEETLTYKKKFGGHNIVALGGFSFQSYSSEYLNSGTARTFITDIFQNNNLSAASTKAQPGTGLVDFKLISYLGRLNYDFQGKYLLTLTGRYDGSSKFGKNNKFAFFPSGAFAWRVSQESFMQGITSISNLKLRASYGFSGNQAISAYATLPRLTNTSVTFNNEIYTGFVQSSLSNSNLKWETTGQLDIGIDLGAFDERVQLTADYYDKKTTDLLLNVNLPTSSGFSTVIQNVGEVGNRGFEVQLTTHNLVGGFKWTSGLTFSHNRTKILDLGNDAQGNPITYKEVGAGGNWFPMFLGNSMQQLYGYKVIGIYQSDEEAAANGEPGKKAGDYKFWNRDGNEVVNGDDRMVLTHLEPKFTFGFNNTFNYKNFDLSLLFVGSYGNDIVNEFRKYNITMNGKWTPTKEAFDNRWKGPGTGNAMDKPSIKSGSTIRDYANSLWVESGNYIRLRDVTLGYTFPDHVLKMARISSLRLYVSAQNFLTFTKYSGYDVEAAWSATTINGWDRGVYPSSKSVTFGLSINF